MINLVQISSLGFSTTLREYHVSCRLGQVLKLCGMGLYILSNPNTDFKHKKFFFPRCQPTSNSLINFLLIIQFGGLRPIQWTPQPCNRLPTASSQNQCKFRVLQCKILSQNGPARLDLPLRKSPNYVYQLTITNRLYQIVT